MGVWLPFSEASQVLCHRAQERQMAGVEVLNLIGAGAGVLGQVEDVHLPMTQNDPHANRSVAKPVDASIAVGHGVMLQAGTFQQQVELPLKDARCRCPVRVAMQKDIAIATSFRIALEHLLMGGDSTCHRVGNTETSLAASDGRKQSFGLRLQRDVIMIQSIEF